MISATHHPLKRAGLYRSGIFSLSLLIFSSINALCADFTFQDAWKQIESHSDVLAASRFEVQRQKGMQDAAGDMKLPNISLGGNYAHLNKPIQVDAAKLEPLASLDIRQVSQALSGLVDTGKISPQFAGEMGNLLQALTGQHLNTTTDITKQGIFTSSIRAIWPLFTGWKISAAQEIAHQKTKEAQAHLALIRQGQFEDLARIYFGVVLAEKVVETRIEAENGLKLHYTHARKMEEEGQIARVERLKAEAAWDQAKVETQKSRRTLEIAQLALTKMLQQTETAHPVSPLFINETLPDLNTFLFQSLGTYPGLALLKAKKKQAQGLIQVEKGHYLPEVYAFGDYNIYKDNSIAGESTPDWVAGIGASITLLDSKGRKGKLISARAALSQVDHLCKQAERDLSMLVEKTYREALQAMEEFHGITSSIALAKENVRLREKGFSQGLATSLDVIDARLFLEKVRTQRLSASYRYVVSLAQLLAISSKLKNFEEYQNNLNRKAG